jgi:pyruvate kinase
MKTLSPATLLHRVELIRRTVEADGRAIYRQWDGMIGNRRFVPAARNLADYLALRQLDLSDLQDSLAALGLSSLGRSEGRVMATLDALRATLARIAEQDDAPPYPPSRRLAEGRRALQRTQLKLFGRGQGGSTAIMVTLPSEAAADAGLARALIDAGMGCARINCAHDDAAAWRAMADNIRMAAAATGQDCRILMDIGGPKIRIEQVYAADRIRLFRGDRLAMVRKLADADENDKAIATISYPEILDRLSVGSDVWINDGHIGTRVAAISPGRVELEVVSARSKGERLKPEKGVNFPSAALEIDPITAQDLADLDTVAELADMVGFSFVQRPEEVLQLHRELARRRPGKPPMPVVLKIETALAVRNLPRLIVQAGGHGPAAVMIARGDLAVELGFARLSEIQEEIMWLCEAAHMPVVWATQVLETLVAEGQPTRAETTDAAMSQRAECVMLNKGPYLPQAVRFLADVLRRMDRHQTKKSARFTPLHSWPRDQLSV